MDACPRKLIPKPFLITASLLLALSLAAPAAAQTGSTGPTVHEVAWGENLYRIALHYGVSVDAIVAANGLSGPDRVFAGQQLVIPSGSAPITPAAAAPAGSHVVQPGENLFRIGLLYGLTTDQLAQANGLSTSSPLYAGQTLQIPGASSGGGPSVAPTPPADGTHVVARGETLFGIAQRYGVSVDALSAANALYNPGLLYAGQTLTIPGASSAPVVGYTPSQAAATHTVAPGETLSGIARSYGVSQSALMQVNNIANPSVLYAGQALTIPNGGALSSAPASGGAGGKRIQIDISEQRMTVYENGQLLWTFLVSTGEPGRPTATGTYHVQNKLPNAYASTWNLQMPNWLGIYWSGPLQNGIHALPILSDGSRMWAGALGHPASYGCIVLGIADAERLYNWAEVGTEVTIVP